jgi:hypothetical protein
VATGSSSSWTSGGTGVRVVLGARHEEGFSEEGFRKLLADNARIVESRTISAGGRVTFLCERRP